VLHIIILAYSAVSVVCFIMGYAIGRFLLLHKNQGEALVANAVAKGFERPHVLLNNITFEIGEGTTQKTFFIFLY